MSSPAASRLRLLKAGLALLLAAPLGWLAWLVWLEVQAPTSGLGADPVEAVVHYLGEWALRMLLVAFSITPLRHLFNALPGTRASLGVLFARSRRMAGLFAFAYVSLHLLGYAALYLQFDWRALLEDFVERAYITAGLAAFVCLLPMALTSTRGWQRRLRQRWQNLHKLVYPALALALIHLWWLTKDGYGELFVYTLWFLLLLALRAAPLRHRAVQ